MSVVSLPLSAGEDTLEMHSMDLEMETATTAESRTGIITDRRSPLPGKFSVRHKFSDNLYSACFSGQVQHTTDAARPDFLHPGAGIPRSLDTAAAEDARQAPDEDLSPSAILL
ncbi:Uncharacterized protein DAT39_018916 [Clarias magur]|uniref:Uncharacterized protein n=1 Tax=Clarias magur TaxID=1594786 RepID=A0A8J4WUF6_CLAMG|nr:Uncharacterized protein DAT39_018916 [Clarias magur]